ncbi:hypothetical protein N9R79_06550 [Vibrio sp.]|nr:hypothetical protein [Vibrio sp.]
MSVINYNALQHNNDMSIQNGAGKGSLGMSLPTLCSATLDCQSNTLTLTEIQEAITKLAPTQGWLMLSDTVTLDIAAVLEGIQNRKDVLEAELSNGETTIVIKHIGRAHYQCLILSKQASQNTPVMAYYDQPLSVRKLSDGQHTTQARYRLWYQCHDHKWTPAHQQFLGFQEITV